MENNSKSAKVINLWKHDVHKQPIINCNQLQNIFLECQRSLFATPYCVSFKETSAHCLTMLHVPSHSWYTANLPSLVNPKFPRYGWADQDLNTALSRTLKLQSQSHICQLSWKRNESPGLPYESAHLPDKRNFGSFLYSWQIFNYDSDSVTSENQPKWGIRHVPTPLCQGKISS